MSDLRIEHLSKSYGDEKLVLDDIHFAVGQGELVSLLGPSGCGKSTTLNIVAGFVNPNSGSIWLGGADITEVAPYRRDTGIVFQNYALFPHLRVGDNVGYGLRARKMPKRQIRERVQDVLEMMSISDLVDKYPGQLSGGQQQRVAVARAVAVRPSVLLMDEPLSNLDAKLRADIRLELRGLQQDLGQTMLFVTHDQEEALSISDRIAVMNEGRIEQIGSPEEVYERPTTVFVADFLGVENIFSGRAQGKGWRSDQGLMLPVPANAATSHVGIRPTQIRLGETYAPTDTPHATYPNSAVVSSVYLGDTVRYVVRADSSDIVAIAGRGAHDLRPGDRTTVTLVAKDLLPLLAEPERVNGPSVL